MVKDAAGTSSCARRALQMAVLNIQAKERGPGFLRHCGHCWSSQVSLHAQLDLCITWDAVSELPCQTLCCSRSADTKGSEHSVAETMTATLILLLISLTP